MRIITLTTDFGLKDPYVGVMKGVIYSINPRVNIIDITHQIDHGDILEAAFILKEIYRFFPKGTIHVAVVDPGVGGKRRSILVKTEDYFFVGPDNGIFWPIIEGEKDPLIINLTNKKYFLSEVSSTFHGRDIFAPVSAYLSKGEDPEKMGDVIRDPVRLRIEKPSVEKDRIIGKVLRVDHFGNLITNISREDIVRKFGERLDLKVKISDVEIQNLSRTYSDVPKGKLLALIGSFNFLEISVNMGNASEKLKKGKGEKVEVTE